ncbi:MAG: outer membrane protein assembly factor BamC [Kangiellaceae bacterium]|nr:outer membrane protein assembly factor BamC [Kangiellaceae bacterium]
MNLIRLSVVVVISSALSACGYIYGDNGLIKSQEYDYLTAKQTKELKIPDTLSHKDKANFTVVPKIGQKAENQPQGKDLTQEAPIQLLAVLDNTRVDKQSDIPAVLVMDNADFVWQTITKFLENNKIKVSSIDETERKITTAWIPIEEGGIWLGIEGDEKAELERGKYQIIIGESNLPGEYRLSVARIESQQREDDDEQWSERRISWQESADMMNLILSYYDTRIRVQEATHQLKIMAGFKVELGQNEQSEAALLTAAEETLVWEKIPRVMRELGMAIMEKDLKQKTYFMEFKAEEEGFFASLFSNDVDNSLFEDGSYQVTVGEVGQQRTLTLKNGEGEAVDATKLVALFPELSRLFGDRR